jgi:DnaK suppressor protein
MATRLPKDYTPSDNEPFMNARQREYFRRKLLDWKEDIIKGTKETVIGLQNESEQHPDDVDRANSEAEKQLELRTRDRHRKLINKIDSALRRIDDKTLWLLRRKRRAHQPETARRAPDCHFGA